MRGAQQTAPSTRIAHVAHVQDVVTLRIQDDPAAAARRASDLLAGIAPILAGRRVAMLQYRFACWLMYPLDYPYARLTGRHLCTDLYHTGLVGTRPQILAERCTHCGICVEAYPLPTVIALTTLPVHPRTCQRCLLCYEACLVVAIAVKGMSGATGAPALVA